MGRRKKDRQAALRRDPIFIRYYNRLCEIAMSRFKWNNLPATVDERFLEMTLYSDGYALFFEDKDLGHLALQCMIGGKLSVYRVPIDRVAYASNGYQYQATDKNSVIIYNNYVHTNDINAIEQFALTLTELEYTYIINCKAQKTPCLLVGEDKQMTTLMNVYEAYDGNAPVILGQKDLLGAEPIKVLTTNAPFVADKIYDMKSRVWNEALTYLGIPNISENKKERMIVDEVERQNGGTLASRNSNLEMRRQACEKINEMFKFDKKISVDFRDGITEFSQLNSNENNNEGGEQND